MNALHSSLYVIAITTCVLCSYVASGTARSRERRFLFLGAYLVLESLGFLFEWLMVHPTSPGKPLWLGSLMALSFLLAPCLWLYAREITEEQRPSIRSLPPRHFLVIAVGMALTLPLIQTTHLGPDYANSQQVASGARNLFVPGTLLACAILFLCQVPWYLKACTRILASNAASAAPSCGVDPRALDTLRILTYVVFTNWLVSLLRTLHCLLLGKDAGLGIVFAFLEVAVTVWAVCLLIRNTIVFSPDHRLARDFPGNSTETSALTTSRDAGKYAKSSLDGPARARIQRKLHDAMALQRLHGHSQLNLRALCQHLRENPHYVSQVINQDLATNFHDLVNAHRVEAAKVSLIESPDMTVMDICMQVGFNSKSTFNAAFRQHAGMTPSEYRDAHVASQRPPRGASNAPTDTPRS